MMYAGHHFAKNTFCDKVRKEMHRLFLVPRKMGVRLTKMTELMLAPLFH